MEIWMLDVVIGIGVILVAAALIWQHDRRRTQRLRERFGPEYDTAISELGDRRRAESELAQREDRVQNMRILHLTESERDRFRDEWLASQARFVDDPDGAVHDADWLLDSIMRAKGYPSETAQDRMDNVSAAFPQFAADYREACSIVANHRRGSTSTEDLRRAFVAYRKLFDEVLEEREEERERAA